MASASEFAFQNEIIQQLVANGWLLGKSENYNRELALYEEDVLGFVQDTQPEQWQKFCALYPNHPEAKFLERVASQLNKADPNAANKQVCGVKPAIEPAKSPLSFCTCLIKTNTIIEL